MADEFLNKYINLRSQPQASEFNITNVQNWLKNHEGAIREQEAAFIMDHEDLIALKPTVRTSLRRGLEKLEIFRHSTIFRRRPLHSAASSSGGVNANAVGTNMRGPLYDSEATFYQKHKMIDKFVNIIICVAGFSMIAAPLWILFYVSSKQHQLAVITVFIAVFLTLVQSVSVARPFESLAATAAYVTPFST